MVGISRFWQPSKSTSELIQEEFQRWKFKVLEDYLDGKSSRIYGTIVLYENVWYTSNYQDTEFHLYEWQHSLEHVRNATKTEIKIFDHYRNLIDTLRDNDD